VLTGRIGRAVVAAVVFAVVAGAAGSAAMPGSSGSVQVSRPGLWAVQVAPARDGSFDRAAVRERRADGFNAIALNVQALGTSRRAVRTFDAVRAFALASKMWLVAVVPAPHKWESPVLSHAIKACKSGANGLRCAQRAP